MYFRNLDKQALKTNGYTVLSKITIVGTNTVFTEDDHIIDWKYEDYRYVPDKGFIGEFVERILDGNLQDISEDVVLENNEINLQIGIVNKLDNNTTWYDYGNFLITKVEKTDTSGNYRFESCDYTKKFNAVYESDIEYPCLALDLAYNVCNKASVDLHTNGSQCEYYIVDENGIEAGNYAIKHNNTYYQFTLTSDLVRNNVLMFETQNSTLTLKTVDYDENTGYSITRTPITYTTNSTLGDYTLLSTRLTGYLNFTNNDFVIENNQYDSDDTLRKVMQDIGKLAYSWVRVGVNNEVYIDFNQVLPEQVDEYDNLTTDEYYTSKKSDLDFGPVNKVLIGMSNAEGENLYKTSQDYTAETECSINVWDNNLTYTEELRAIALCDADKLFGLTYMPLEIETIGHPWLEGNELIKLINVDEEELYTYPFNRTLTYSGYITSTIGADAQTTKETEYEYNQDIISEVRKTKFIVDKDNQTITSLVADVNDAESNITELQQTTSSIGATVDYLNEEYVSKLLISNEEEGNPIEIENGTQYPLNDFKIYGNSKQDTTTGKNIAYISDGTNTGGGVDWEVKRGILYINGTTNSSSSKYWDTFTTNSGSAVFSLDVTGYTDKVSSNPYVRLQQSTTGTSGWSTVATLYFDSNSSKEVSVTLDSTKYYRLLIYVFSSCVFTNSAVKIQLEYGTTKTSFEPFSYGKSPNPNFPQTIQSVTSKIQSQDYSGTHIDIEYDFDIADIKIENGEVDFYGDTKLPVITPSPDNPQNLQKVTGLQKIKVCGKNMFDYVSNIVDNGGLTSTIDSDGTIITTGVPSSNNVSIIDNDYDITEQLEVGEFYTFSQEENSYLYLKLEAYNNSTGTSTYYLLNSGTSISFQVEENVNYKLIIQSTTTSEWGENSRTITNKYQLEKGNIKTDFEKYMSQVYNLNLGSIELNKIHSDEYKDVIKKSTGKNLFTSFIKGKGLSATDGSETVDAKSAVTDFIPVDFNTNPNYYLSGLSNTLNVIVCGYNSYKEFINSKPLTANTTGFIINSQVFTGGTSQGTGDIVYIRITQGTTSTNPNPLDVLDTLSTQLEIGNSRTDAEVPGVGNWYVSKKVKKEKIGNLSWSRNSTNNYFYYNLGSSRSPITPTVYSSYYRYGGANSASDWGTVANYTCGTTTNTYNIVIKDTDYTTTSTFKTAREDIDFYYPIKIAEYEKITSEDLINQLNEIQNFELSSSINHYQSSSSNLNIGSIFTLYSKTYETIDIEDENHNKLIYRPLFENLELCGFSDYTDYLYLKDGKWYKYCVIGKKVYTGATEENWQSGSDGTNSYYIALDDRKIPSDTSPNYNLSNLFRGVPYSQRSEAGNNIIYNDLTLGLYVRNTSITSIADFKTMLGTTNLYVYYILETPTSIEITDTGIINELNRLMQNNIYEGYNKILLTDPICNKLYIKYLTNSELNSVYASKSSLEMTNDNVSILTEKSNNLETNVANLQLSVNGISTSVESVETITTNLENSINYLAVDMSANSLIIPTNDENKPYLTNTYTIPFTATFKGTSVNPTVTTSSASVTGITLTFGTGVINVAVSSSTAIANLSNSFVINFTYIDGEETYVVSKTLNIALSVKGEDGKDGTSVTILGSYNSLADLQAAHPTGSAGDSYMVGNDLYVWNVSSLAWVDVGQIKGEDGVNSYIYIRYSENADGNPMVTTPTSSTKYIGVVTTTSNTAPTSYNSYTWSKYSGIDGETAYLHVKYSEDGSTFVPASLDAAEGDTPSAWVGILTDTNETASTDFDDYTWYKFTEDIEDTLIALQNDIVKNASDIDSNYKAIMKNFDGYATADTVATLKSRVETLETDDAYAINIIKDLQINGVSQVRTEKGFTFDNNGMTIDATNSVSKSITDTNGMQVIDKTGSSESELLFAGYDENSKSSVVRTENLKVKKYLIIGTYSRLEDYEDGTGVFDV